MGGITVVFIVDTGCLAKLHFVRQNHMRQGFLWLWPWNKPGIGYPSHSAGRSVAPLHTKAFWQNVGETTVNKAHPITKLASSSSPSYSAGSMWAMVARPATRGNTQGSLVCKAAVPGPGAGATLHCVEYCLWKTYWSISVFIKLLRDPFDSSNWQPL